MRALWVVPVLLLVGCSKPAPEPRPSLTVAAAANLREAFEELSKAFTGQTGVPVSLVYGSTAQLAQQCEQSAPFDVFAAADTEHIDDLIRKGHLLSEGRAIYARGQVALWVPGGESAGIRTLDDLVKPEVRFIAVATPATAPYGAAAVESLRAAGLWSKVENKVVYSSNVNAAKQYASTGNAEAAFTAHALVVHEKGTVIRVEEKLHKPLDQALSILTSSQKQDAARRFRQFVLGSEGRAVLGKYGYEFP